MRNGIPHVVLSTALTDFVNGLIIHPIAISRSFSEVTEKAAAARRASVTGACGPGRDDNVPPLVLPCSSGRAVLVAGGRRNHAVAFPQKGRAECLTCIASIAACARRPAGNVAAERGDRGRAARCQGVPAEAPRFGTDLRIPCLDCRAGRCTSRASGQPASPPDSIEQTVSRSPASLDKAMNAPCAAGMRGLDPKTDRPVEATFR